MHCEDLIQVVHLEGTVKPSSGNAITPSTTIAAVVATGRPADGGGGGVDGLKARFIR